MGAGQYLILIWGGSIETNSTAKEAYIHHVDG